jgi:hypothetical protein
MKLIDLPVRSLLLLSFARIPVEFMLHALAEKRTIPAYMSFDGWNFDVLSGAGAMILWFLLQTKRQVHPVWIRVWNLVGLALLLNVVICGILSIPSSFQRFNFDQPNVAMLHFPYVLLPGLVVPLVLFSHLTLFLKWSADPLLKVKGK